MILDILQRVLFHSSLIERLVSLIGDIETGEASEEDIKREITRIDEEERRLIDKWDAILNPHIDE